ncbi:MAG: type I-C CRISPR-associated protein Cas5c, partial [Luteolibacter sp.]
MKAERVSYDVPTPSAARGIIEAIYWKPQIRWVISKIHVLNTITFTNIRRNEVAAPGSSGHKITASTANAVMRTGSAHHGIVIEEFRQQRASMVLLDVAYIIEATLVVRDPRERNGVILADPAAKHLRQFNDRALAGQCRNTPCFGCREFPARFELIEGEIPKSPL